MFNLSIYIKQQQKSGPILAPIQLFMGAIFLKKGKEMLKRKKNAQNFKIFWKSAGDGMQ